MRFKKIYIEITNQCNLKCSFCIQNQRKSKYLSIDEFSYILNEIRPFTDYIYLHVLGEPLLHPLFKDFLQIACEKGFKVNLTTNGTLIKKVEDLLINSPALRQINFSIHSFEANEQNTTLEDYLLTVATFIERVQEIRPIYCNLRLWNMDAEE